MKTEITKIKIQFSGREIELTGQEAKDLQKELNKLFEAEKVYTPLQLYYTPIVNERPTPYTPRPGEIWCQMVGANSGTLGSASGSLAQG